MVEKKGITPPRQAMENRVKSIETTLYSRLEKLGTNNVAFIGIDTVGV
jgi:hypothetical protein